MGVAEKAHLYPRIDTIEEGDVVIGLASSGLHSNGFSLVRRILEENNIDIQSVDPQLSDKPISQTLLTPTRIYVQPVLKALQAHPDAVKAMAHVTGGGFYDNLPRVLPNHLGVSLDSTSWDMPPVFDYIKNLGNLTNETLWHTFNAGVGYVLIAKASKADNIISTLKANGCNYSVQVIGEVVSYVNQNEATPTPHPRIHIQ